MIIYIDIDDTICYKSNNNNYNEAKPNYNNIEKVNQLYLQDHTIVMWTARGTLTNINWFETRFIAFQCSCKIVSASLKTVLYCFNAALKLKNYPQRMFSF